MILLCLPSLYALCPMLSVYLDCPFLIVPSVFSSNCHYHYLIGFVYIACALYCTVYNTVFSVRLCALFGWKEYVDIFLYWLVYVSIYPERVAWRPLTGFGPPHLCACFKSSTRLWPSCLSCLIWFNAIFAKSEREVNWMFTFFMCLLVYLNLSLT